MEGEGKQYRSHVSKCEETPKLVTVNDLTSPLSEKTWGKDMSDYIKFKVSEQVDLTLISVCSLTLKYVIKLWCSQLKRMNMVG